MTALEGVILGLIVGVLIGHAVGWTRGRRDVYDRIAGRKRRD